MHWFPLLGNGSSEQSFPSSHTATAAGLAIVLAYFYPRGRWFFPALAALAGFQRVTEQSHFLSDVFWGAAVGCIFAPLCVYGSRIARRFDVLEARLLVRRGIIAGVLPPHGRANTTVAEIAAVDRPAGETPGSDLPDMPRAA